MEIITTVNEMQQKCEDIRLGGKSIAFVPTMGFLHEGHMELMRVARQRADVVVISIFVNPTQFGPTEDFEEYPRDMEGDLSKAEKTSVDIVFAPAAEEMYPEGFQTKVHAEGITKYLCGQSRPGHFDGVATVVVKLFNIVAPHFAIFGQKDFQQLAVIDRMVKDLNMPIEVIGVPTVRESDGLAMSSRNKYLSPEERKSALCIKESIDLALSLVKDGERNTVRIKSLIQKLILSYPFSNVDYISICDPATMEEMETLEGKSLLALAVKIGKTRLIDNCLLDID